MWGVRGRGGGSQGQSVAMRTWATMQTKPHTGWAVATHTMIQMHGRALAIARTGRGRVSGGGQAVAMVATLLRRWMGMMQRLWGDRRRLR